MLRALVVDDNARALAALTERLAASGEIYVVGWAASGKDALAKVDLFFPNLVLLDLNLGDMSGFDVARSIKQRPNPPFVAIVTVHDEPEYEAAASDAGADLFLSKWSFAEQMGELLERAKAYMSRGP